MELLYRVRPTMRLDAADKWPFQIRLERVLIKVTCELYIPDLAAQTELLKNTQNPQYLNFMIEETVSNILKDIKMNFLLGKV